ncbi:MAG: S-layer homology domain-containing protein [Acholeplasmataceae bacterium]|nr:S-layer homology domain-containing protein [Acholeplasmataceae bacterium]
MKKSLVLAMAMALGISATAFAANPFSDVPAGHWAYASVAKLAAAGVVDGYPDGTFKGDNLMTRYEMAQIVAKAYAKGGIGSDDKLMAEFADELDNLGVRVAKLEKKSDNIKIAGQARFGYKDGEAYLEGYKTKFHSAELRTRLYLSGAINDDWSYGAMLQNTQELNTNAQESPTDFRRAFVTGNVGGATVTAGRQAFTIGQGYVADLTGDALKVDFGNKLKTTLFAGRFDSVVYKDANYWTNNNDRATLYGAVVNYPFSDKLYTELAFYAQEEKGDLGEQQVFTAGLGYTFDKNVSVYGEYQKADKSLYELGAGDTAADFGDDGWAATVSYKGADAGEKGSWGAYATYYDQSAAVMLDSVSEIEDHFVNRGQGLKGYEVGVGYTLQKNIVANLSYFDVENKDVSQYKGDVKMLWSTVTFSF